MVLIYTFILVVGMGCEFNVLKTNTKDLLLFGGLSHHWGFEEAVLGLKNKRKIADAFNSMGDVKSNPL